MTTLPPIPVTLRPCQFCHGDSIEQGANVQIVTAENGYEHYVECKDCRARGPEWDFDNSPPDFQQIAAHWNRHVYQTPDRADHSEDKLDMLSLVGELEALRKPSSENWSMAANSMLESVISIFRQHPAQDAGRVDEADVKRVAMVLAAKDFEGEQEQGMHWTKEFEDVGLYVAECWGIYKDMATAAIAALTQKGDV